MSLLKASWAKGCVLVGDPGYYKRFGFKNLPDLVLDGVSQEYRLYFNKDIASDLMARRINKDHTVFFEAFTYSASSVSIYT